MSDWTAIIGGALTILTTIMGVWARSAHRRLRAAEREQERVAGLERELRTLRDEKLADLENENAKLKRGLEALEAARNADLERHEAERQQWRATTERQDRELADLRTKLDAASEKIRDLELRNARLEVQNSSLREDRDRWLKMAERWDGYISELAAALATRNEAGV